jgi:ribonuclease P protein subunit POP4
MRDIWVSPHIKGNFRASRYKIARDINYLMPITPRNLVRHELIGLKVRIKKSTDPSHVGVRGRVIDETYNTLKIECRDKEKIISKANTVFIFTLPDKVRVQVDGRLLIGRPEDRIKKKFPRW